ncbi:MAG: hypothetical protein ABSB75_01335 [Candidatus Limnocylindrales bacterium]
MSEWGHPELDFGPLGAGSEERYETIELVGPHLRVKGSISLLRFTRLTDLINNSRGYVRLIDAELLRRNGDPTGLVVSELMVNQDEITFIGQTEGEAPTAESGKLDGVDRPLMSKTPRQLVIFTPGHTISGTVHLFGETDIATFVDSGDPRFVPMTQVTARSLADRRVISHFALALVNRTQMTAASLLEKSGGVHESISVE